MGKETITVSLDEYEYLKWFRDLMRWMHDNYPRPIPDGWEYE